MGSGTRTVSYGVIGAGMMGREHLLNLFHLRSHGISVVCIADPYLPSQHRALQLAQSFHCSLKVFSRHQELLDSGLCDVVVLSTPNMTHYEILMDIINHQKPHHILVEKPLCTTIADCKKVVEAARRRSEIFVQVGLEYRYMPPIAKLIEIVKAGKVGQVKMVAIREHRFPFLVKVNNWNRFNVNSGGTLVEKCCHFFDLMRLFTSANPIRVMASGAMNVNHKDEIYDGMNMARECEWRNSGSNNPYKALQNYKKDPTHSIIQHICTFNKMYNSVKDNEFYVSHKYRGLMRLGSLNISWKPMMEFIKKKISLTNFSRNFL